MALILEDRSHVERPRQNSAASCERPTKSAPGRFLDLGAGRRRHAADQAVIDLTAADRRLLWRAALFLWMIFLSAMLSMGAHPGAKDRLSHRLVATDGLAHGSPIARYAGGNEGWRWPWARALVMTGALASLLPVGHKFEVRIGGSGKVRDYRDRLGDECKRLFPSSCLSRHRRAAMMRARISARRRRALRSDRMNLLRALATVSGMTLLSRILGFVRDLVIAAPSPAGMATDAFFVAFRLPNLLRRMFAEARSRRPSYPSSPNTRTARARPPPTPGQPRRPPCWGWWWRWSRRSARSPR